MILSIYTCNLLRLLSLFPQTIFHLLPALTGVIQEEWIPLDAYSDFSVASLPLQCNNKKLFTLLDDISLPFDATANGVHTAKDVSTIDIIII